MITDLIVTSAASMTRHSPRFSLSKFVKELWSNGLWINGGATTIAGTSVAGIMFVGVFYNWYMASIGIIGGLPMGLLYADSLITIFKDALKKATT